MGYRVNGNDDFKVIRKYNGIDFSKMLVSYSLTGKMGDTLVKDNPCFPQYSATLCLYLHGGVIGKIDYFGLVGKKGIDNISMKRCVGNRIIENGTNGQKAGMIEDLEGNNMLLAMFDEKRLLLSREEGINGGH